jgi:hypothetical protein
MPFGLFKKSPERVERERKEKELRRTAFEEGRRRGIRKRAYREGVLSSRPFSEKLGDFAGGISDFSRALDSEFGFGSSPRRRRSKKRKK